MLLASITFGAAPEPGLPPLKVELPVVTVLVGPNNSGKSQALRDVETLCKSRTGGPVVESAAFEVPSDPDECLRLLFPLLTARNDQVLGWTVQRHGVHEDSPSQVTIVPNGQIQDLTNASDWNSLSILLFQSLTARLDGETRLQLMGPRSSAPRSQPPGNVLEALWRDQDAQSLVRDAAKRAFGLYFAIDNGERSRLTPYMSRRDPAELRYGDNHEFFASATPLMETGDGVRAFVGLLAAVASLPDKVILIDEPEAFLSGGSTRVLGQELVTLASRRDARLMVATHSPDFLLGCLEASAPSIIRLTWNGSRATARKLESTDMKELARNPRLRSAGAFETLLRRSVVVTESDVDRCFYEEVNRRLLAEGRGLEDCAIINSPNGNAHIAEFLVPLRNLGISAAAIFDLDSLRTDSIWPPIWTACALTHHRVEALEAERLNVKEMFEKLGESGLLGIKRKGIDALPDPDRPKAEHFLAELRKLGIFLCPCGELESWLEGSCRDGKKSRFLDRVLEAMGDDPGSGEYLRPDQGDVWAFLDSIAGWLQETGS